LVILILRTLLQMTVVYFILGAAPVLDVVTVVLLTFHDAVQDSRGAVLAVVLRATSQLSLFTLAMALVDVAASVAGASVLIEVGVEVTVPCVVLVRLVGVVLIEPLLDWGRLLRAG
jgi:phage tail tape-measure protein